MLADVPGLRALVTQHFLPPPDEAPATQAAVVIRRTCQHALLVHMHALAVTEAWPAAVRDALVAARQEQVRDALRHAQALAVIQQACKAAGVRMLALKGVALAALLHGDVGARQSGDLDLLVAPGDLGTMANLLASLGFSPEPRWRDASAARFDEVASTFHEFGFASPDGLLIEVHTRLTTAFIPYVPDVDALWRDRQTVTIAGAAVATLGWADAIVHLSTHGYRHGWARLGWLCDIAHAMARVDAWPEVIRRARAGREVVAVEGAVALAHELLGAPVPAGVTPGRRARRAADAVAARMRAGRLVTTGRSMLADQWRSRDTLAESLRYLWRVATTITPADGGPSEPWPPPPFTRYVRRPVRLVRRYLVKPRPGAAPSAGR